LNKFLEKELWFDKYLCFDMGITNDFMKQNIWIDLEWKVVLPWDFEKLTNNLSKHFMQLLEKQTNNNDPILEMINKKLLFNPLEWIKKLNYYLWYNFELKQELWLPQDRDSWKNFFITENFGKYNSLEIDKFIEDKKDNYWVGVSK
jgi:hypothetical protein